MKKSSILLVTTSQHQQLNKFCIPNYKYVAIKNNIDYDHKKIFDINNTIDDNYQIIIHMNHYSIFLTHNIKKLLLELSSSDVNIILPDLINMPVELIPMILKNCSWSSNFFKLYNRSHTYNLKKFMQMYSFDDSQNKHIKYSNCINNSSKPSNMKQDIIKQFIQSNYNDTIENMSYINTKLGIL